MPALVSEAPARNAKATQRFLGKALIGLKDWQTPETINTDKAPTYGTAIAMRFGPSARRPFRSRRRQACFRPYGYGSPRPSDCRRGRLYRRYTAASANSERTSPPQAPS